MKVYIEARSLKEKYLKALEAKFTDIEFVYNKEESYDSEVIVAMASFVTEANLKDYRNLKWIQIATAGFDTSDIDYARNRGIQLTNGKDVYSVAIAEDVVGKILILNRNVRKYMEDMKTGTWDPLFFEPEIFGSTVGIIGTGSIAVEIAKRLKAFETKVVGYKRSEAKVENFDEIYVGEKGLEKLLQTSDYVILAVPLNDGTKDLMDYAKFKLMKNNALLVNIARGEVVVQDDLVRALNEGLIRGAALDVMIPEPLPKDNPLWKMNNVYITPHCSSSSHRFTDRIVWLVEENLNNYIKGKELKNHIRQ